MDQQSELKAKAAAAAVDYIKDNTIVGVGTGTTVGFFIPALALSDKKIKGCVSSSNATTQQLLAFGLPVCELNDIPDRIPVYVDGCDEIDHNFNMIKGGGGALTNEKVIAQEADTFICIADKSKLVDHLGTFPLPVEVLPKAVSSVTKALEKMGGTVSERDFTTDNGNKILDVKGLDFSDPRALEEKINQIPGVVTNGIFAHRGADILLLGTTEGVKVLKKQAPA